MHLLRSLFLCLCCALSLPVHARETTVWVARYPLSPQHPAVAIGWANMQAALSPAIDLQLRLHGPRLGTQAALEALSRGQHQVGIIPLASYPKAFPYWALLGEMFMIGHEPLAAAAAVTELVMLECQTCQENLARRKLVFLGTYGAGRYGVIAPGALAEPDSFKGQRLATPGSLWDRLALHLGGTVAGAMPEPRRALAMGEVTALIDVPSALLDTHLAGHSITLTRLPLGSYRGASPLTINRNAWAELSPGQRSSLFRAAAISLVQITASIRFSEQAALVKAHRDGAVTVGGSPLLSDRIRSFAVADLAAVLTTAEERFGITDAPAFAERLKELFDKYATLLAPPVNEAAAIALLQREIFDRLDPEAYGLE